MIKFFSVWFNPGPARVGFFVLLPAQNMINWIETSTMLPRPWGLVMRERKRFRWFCVLVPAVGFGVPVHAEDEFERAPISYSQTAPENSISRLQERLDRGELVLEYEPRLGYLPSVLKALDVPVASQMLVFSKTSLQIQQISPRTPRALYFNDDVYIGFCQQGEVLEISAADPKLGTVFYTLDQEQAEKPKFARQVDNCLLCHSSSRTEGVPGHLVRSLFVDPGGQPIFSAGSKVVDHKTPFEDRWGGWYVTGQHGAQKHLGNLVINGKEVPRPVENAQGQNVSQLNDRIRTSAYLTPHSDIVALMILGHQALVHNKITRANFVTRQALDYDAMMNKALGYPEGKRLDSTNRRIASAGDDLIEALLLVGEPRLPDPVKGTSEFAAVFQAGGLRDSQGRSLRDLDLAHRLFKYPCSYLIESRSFDGLPPEMREYVWKRLWKILSGEDRSEKFAHLSDQDRQAILDIIRATKPDLPGYWKQ